MADPTSRTRAEHEAVRAVLGDDPPAHEHTAIGGHELRSRRHLLLPALHAVNDSIGWVSPSAMEHIADRLDLGRAEVFAVASFYSLFSLDEREGPQEHLCIDIACRANGGPVGDDLPDGGHASPCLGLCERAPARLTLGPGAAPAPEPPPVATVPQAGSDDLVLLRRAGRHDPLDLDAYLADRGFRALERARTLGPAGVVELVERSGLTGRGGAAFPTARKWEAVRTQAATPHHLVCNADESEPGTFKDRALIENDPYALLESMAIAALATGCDHGWIYLRGEYPRAHDTLAAAIERCRERGVLGDFDVTIFRGAGAYVCGEETAIFNSIEGYRGEPRNKPPFPFESGLFGLPTVVNNVETLMNVPSILLDDRRATRRLFCVSGAVAAPGVYEVELGITLGDLIGVAGGLRTGSELQAVLLGGAAGGFVGPDDLDLALDQPSVADIGLTLGSGVVMVHDRSVDLVDQLRRIAAFFRDESCGQCVPCRVGTVRQDEALARLAERVTHGDLALLDDIRRAMADASICGLGHTAGNAVESAIVRLGVFS